MQFYIVGLTTKEIQQGKKEDITQAICNEYYECVKKVRAQFFTLADKKQAEIFIENYFTNRDFEKQYKTDQDILYINEVAKKILDKNRISLRVYGKVKTPPKHIGLVQSIAVYSK